MKEKFTIGVVLGASSQQRSKVYVNHLHSNTMRNDESLLNFIQSQVEPGTSEVRLSAYGIAKEWKIKKNHLVTEVTPVEVTTSRAYVHKLLKKLQDDNKIIYKTEGTKTPIIKIL